ncbi:MAG: hypothetical protein F6K11_30440 [Leptolyngbya sp. SIO3F4]|nr:hypothetical protein [Leptolyngbya sp. SIO3F4]
MVSAILYFAQHDHQVFDWIIITHQSSLSPELDLLTFTRYLVRTRLNEKGWIQGRDFWFDLRNMLRMSQAVSIHFDDYFDQGELILIKSVLVMKPSYSQDL